MSFEFTKRKRWPDLLTHELSDAIAFVLSTDNAIIWFCGRAVAELLGWSDAELLGRPFTDLVNSEDQRPFFVAFDEALRTSSEMTTLLRLRARSPITPHIVLQSEILFEIKGHPHFFENELVSQCFLAVAKPFPSRNMAMLDTYLELQIEHERLQKRLAELRVCASSPSAPISVPTTTSVYPLRSFTRSSISLCPSEVPSSQQLPRLSHDNLCSPLTATQLHGPACESLGPHTYGTHCTPVSNAQPTDDDLGDDVSKRKKTRKPQTTEQYVCITCGRTDSPEWRKGPQGPKTLCNACGLRWAKEVRSKVGEGPASGTGNSTSNA